MKPSTCFRLGTWCVDDRTVTHVYAYSLEDPRTNLHSRPRSESLVLNLEFCPLPGHILPKVAESRGPVGMGVQIVACEFAMGPFVHRGRRLGFMDFNILFLVCLRLAIMLGQGLFIIVDRLNVDGWIGREPIGRWLLRLRLSGMRTRHRDTRNARENR